MVLGLAENECVPLIEREEYDSYELTITKEKYSASQELFVWRYRKKLQDSWKIHLGFVKCLRKVSA